MGLIKKILNSNVVVDVLDDTGWQWRRGRLGKLADRHSPTAHVSGSGCWCQLNLKKPWDVSQAFWWGAFQVEMRRNRLKFKKDR